MQSPWTQGKIDGRTLKRRDKSHILIKGVQVHALGYEDGMVWDCVNGFRADVVDMTATFAAIDAPEHPPVYPHGHTQTPAQDHALRIWSGQSIDVPVAERVRRVVVGLQEQGMDLDITLPHPDAGRHLETY